MAMEEFLMLQEALTLLQQLLRTLSRHGPPGVLTPCSPVTAAAAAGRAAGLWKLSFIFQKGLFSP
jgi:hypothetical protein